MHKQVTCVTVVLFSIALSSCLKVNSSNHDPRLAAGKAQMFADAAFVDRKFPAAYALLSQSTSNQLSFEQFTDWLSRMHPSQYPSSVQAVEYEPLMGQQGMNIYLEGQNRDEKFYYRLYMEGSKETDYTVGGFWRRDGPYPPSEMKKRLN